VRPAGFQSGAFDSETTGTNAIGLDLTPINKFQHTVSEVTLWQKR